MRLNETVSIFDNVDMDLDMNFSDDVPQEFIDLWKEKQDINRKFNKMVEGFREVKSPSPFETTEYINREVKSLTSSFTMMKYP